MQTWQAWLNSLATRGGAILILLYLVMLGIGVTILAVHKGWDNSMIIGGMIASLGNFSGALLLALKGSSDPTPPPMIAQQTTTTSTSSTIPPVVLPTTPPEAPKQP